MRDAAYIFAIAIILLLHYDHRVKSDKYKEQLIKEINNRDLINNANKFRIQQDSLLILRYKKIHTSH